MSLAFISLPNLPICGLKVLLADIPYVFLNLSNQSSTSESIGTLYSNNPNALHATFMCPISNIRNPDTIKYVVVKSPQKFLLKLKPNDDLFVRVTLPNGVLLRFSQTLSETDLCISDLPVSFPFSPNSPKIFTPNPNIQISFSLLFEKV